MTLEADVPGKEGVIVGLCEQDEGVKKTKDSKNDLQLDVSLLSVVCLRLFTGLGHV